MTAKGCAFLASPLLLIVGMAVFLVALVLGGGFRSAIGIVYAVLGCYFLISTARMWPPGTYRSQYLHPSTSRDIAAGFVVGAMLAGAGVVLIRS